MKPWGHAGGTKALGYQPRGRWPIQTSAKSKLHARFDASTSYANQPSRPTPSEGAWQIRNTLRNRATLKTYANPHLGTHGVDQIATPDVLRVLAPIWLTKPETARRVRQRIATVLNWTKAAGHRSGDNPVEGVAKGLPKQTDTVEHHAALPFTQVPAFVTRLHAADRGEITKLAFEFLILTVLRTGEVLGARWEEIDTGEAVWTVPAQRMKMKRAHRVPLSPRALAILERSKLLAGDSPYVFPGQKPGKPLSNMAFEMTLRRMQVPVTAHGFRSSFRDWAAETTKYPNKVAEMALAHAVANRVEAAYRRGDLLEKRRELMDCWSAFLVTL